MRGSYVGTKRGFTNNSVPTHEDLPSYVLYNFSLNIDGLAVAVGGLNGELYVLGNTINFSFNA